MFQCTQFHGKLVKVIEKKIFCHIQYKFLKIKAKKFREIQDKKKAQCPMLAINVKTC